MIRLPASVPARALALMLLLVGLALPAAPVSAADDLVKIPALATL
jgi:hypothetical protein